MVQGATTQPPKHFGNKGKNINENIALLGALGTSSVYNVNEAEFFNSYTGRTGLYYPNVFSLQNMKGDFNKGESITKVKNHLQL